MQLSVDRNWPGAHPKHDPADVAEVKAIMDAQRVVLSQVQHRSVL